MQRALKIAAFSAVAASATEVSSAKVWLQSHGAPNQDELAELKGENPDAYAIVKALLTKRSLGLLDPKHPTASFASTAAPAEAAPVGAAAFALSEQDQEAMGKKDSGAAPADDAYPEIAAAPRHHDWMNWKPADSAIDDDAMVKNVLGSVANLVGSKPKQAAADDSMAADEASILGEEKTATAVKVAPITQVAAVETSAPIAPVAQAASADSGSLASEEASILGEEKPAVPVKVAPIVPVAAAAEAAPVASVAPEASLAEGNSYLKNIDFGLKPDVAAATQSSQASAVQSNSYLRGIDFGFKTAAVEEAPVAAKPVQSLAGESKDVNYLASFNWDDSKPQQKPTPAPAAPQPKKKSALNYLSSWLGGSARAAPAAAAPAAEKAATPTANPYAMQW